MRLAHARPSLLPAPLRAATLLALALLAPLTAGAAPGTSSPDGVWQEVMARPSASAAAIQMIDRPRAYRTYQLDPDALGAVLARAPREAATTVRRRPVVLTVPMPDGSFARFSVLESSILSEALQAEHPELRTYVGQGLDDRTATARFDRTPEGFHAQILSASGTVIVDPHHRGDAGRYISFALADLPAEPGDFACLNTDAQGGAGAAIGAAAPSGAALRTYRLAMTATGEYTQFFGGVPQAQAQITTTINRVVGIFEREVAIRLSIVFFNIYADPTSDPFPSGASVTPALLSENQSDLDARVPGGPGGYDIGHIVSRGGAGGLAFFGVCDNLLKAQAGTSRASPFGDAFDVDYVAHEMGHQFHAEHTFNGTTLSCAGSRVATSAYEPGSGSTIMAYAGICGAENLQPNSDPFFHTRSFDQIVAFRDGGGICGPAALTGNSPPTVDAGPDVTIPTATPFRLTALGLDPDGDALTYCWEEVDLGAASPPPNVADGPLFRSLPPAAIPQRVLPKMATLLSGSIDPWERLPTVARDLNFRCTVRDNRAGGGGVSYDAMVVHVSGAPFHVTFPNGGEVLEAGGPVAVTWSVGGGSVAASVNILYAADGASFAPLLSATANDGSETVTLPCTPTTHARIMVEAADNIFFDVSDADFAVADRTAPAIAFCPGTLVVQSASREGTYASDPTIAAFLASFAATDGCGPPVLSNDAPTFFPQGTTVVTFTATDAALNASQCSAAVKVVDRTPPGIADDPAREATRTPAPALGAESGITELVGVVPNPTRATATVVLSLARETEVDLAVYDLRGARVRTLHRGVLGPGRHTVAWDGRDQAGRALQGGVYFVRMSAGAYQRTLKTAIMP